MLLRKNYYCYELLFGGFAIVWDQPLKYHSYQVERYHRYLMPSKKVLAAFTGLLIGPQVLGITQLPVLAGAVPAPQPDQFYQKPLPKTQLSQTYQKPLPPVGQPGVFGLTDGTPVKLKTKEDLSSKTAKTNDPIELEVAEAVKVGNIVVIPEGAVAKGVVIEAKRGKMLGRKGKLSIAVNEVTLATGERVALRASKASGGGLSAGVIAASVILTPIFLLLGGSNVTYKAGTEVEAFINGNYALEPAKFRATTR